ncbi:MAG: single-stranded-DNA-specific exonuclease RecJ, partial [Clostridia bacterium]|nr:single-stranded-DNA-specific exonuclease RecJ [Clostridia bacterium]
PEKTEYDPATRETAEKVGLTLPAALLLRKRGLESEREIRDFLELKKKNLHNPFLLPDMEKACERIIRAVENREKITVYGDYDVDGITSTTTVYLYLRSRGADVGYFIPNRAEEGYGVVSDAVDRLADLGTKLFVTVDTGVTAVEEVERAALRGCDFVITDHHECREILPPAEAVVNPKRRDSAYPCEHLCGAGVAFKLVTALEITFAKRERRPVADALDSVIREYVDLAAIGTVADVVPLLGENRLIVSMGLIRINSDMRLGLRALLDMTEKPGTKSAVTVQTISYGLAPRLNAAGRMESAEMAVRLFMSSVPSEATEIAGELCRTNQRRKQEELAIDRDIDGMISADPSLADARVIVLCSESWHHGVIGIAASRIMEKYGKPCILVSFDGDVGKGSGRSVRGFNLASALDSCRDCLIKYGGHELAAGLSVSREMFGTFRQRINDCAAGCASLSSVPEAEADLILLPEEITYRLAGELELFEPCGAGNPQPAFVTRNLTVVSSLPLGNGHHTKLRLSGGGREFNVLKFGSSPSEIGAAAGDSVDILYRLSLNRYNGRTSEQVTVSEILPSEGALADRAAELERYRMMTAGKIAPEDAEMPSRQDFAAVYRFFRSLGGEETSFSVIGRACGIDNYVKLRLVADILGEAGIVNVSETPDGFPGFETLRVSVNETEGKVDLEKTCLYKTLKNSREKTRDTGI